MITENLKYKLSKKLTEQLNQFQIISIYYLICPRSSTPDDKVLMITSDKSISFSYVKAIAKELNFYGKITYRENQY